MSVTFDPATHTYALDGRIVPSVTQMLQTVGLIEEHGTAADLLRGQYVAEATALDDRDDLDFADPAIMGYVEAWRLCRKECEFGDFVGIEEVVWHTDHSYAGRLDRRGHWRGQPYVLDIKTGARQRWHGVQLAAYAECLFGGRQCRRLAAYLTSDGKYKLQDYNDYHDIVIWEAALTLYHWRNKR